VPAMIDALARNAARRGLGVKATVERADALAPRSEPLELIWVGCGMYSTIPSRRRRVAFLKRLGEQIAPDGRVALSFLLAPYSPVSPRAQSARRALARVLFGYADVQ